MVAQFENLMSAAQVGKALGISSNAVAKLCDAGELQHFRIGSGQKKRYRLRPSVVEAYLAKCQAKPSADVKPAARKKQTNEGGFDFLRQHGYRG